MSRRFKLEIPPAGWDNDDKRGLRRVYIYRRRCLGEKFVREETDKYKLRAETADAGEVLFTSWLN